LRPSVTAAAGEIRPFPDRNDAEGRQSRGVERAAPGEILDGETQMIEHRSFRLLKIFTPRFGRAASAQEPAQTLP
jgi:hypothetical protein